MLTEACNKVPKDPLGIDPYPSSGLFFFFFAKSRSVFGLFPRSPIPPALILTDGKML